MEHLWYVGRAELAFRNCTRTSKMGIIVLVQFLSLVSIPTSVEQPRATSAKQKYITYVLTRDLFLSILLFTLYFSI